MPRWFRRKRWGYGWTPCTWQGWVVMAVFTAGVAAAALETTVLGPTRTFAAIGAMTVALLAVMAFTSGKDSDNV